MAPKPLQPRPPKAPEPQQSQPSLAQQLRQGHQVPSASPRTPNTQPPALLTSSHCRPPCLSQLSTPLAGMFPSKIYTTIDNSSTSIDSKRKMTQTSRHGTALRGVAWRGVAWRGVAWRGVAFCCSARAPRTPLLAPLPPTRIRNDDQSNKYMHLNHSTKLINSNF